MNIVAKPFKFLIILLSVYLIKSILIILLISILIIRLALTTIKNGKGGVGNSEYHCRTPTHAVLITIIIRRIMIIMIARVGAGSLGVHFDLAKVIFA